MGNFQYRFLLQQLSVYFFFYREIWARFLAFESNIGDLASILKVEKRRFTAFKEEYEGKETALLVDRYKFMDLYPCSASELKALGYKVSGQQRLHSLLCFSVIAKYSSSLFSTSLTFFFFLLDRKVGKTGLVCFPLVFFVSSLAGLL